MRIALVLGAGGAAGWVFHSGVAYALAEQAGWDARKADLFVGTSAGSAIAAGLRAGTSPLDLIAAVTRGPSEQEREEYAEMLAQRQRSFKPLQPGLLRHALPGGNGNGVGVALAGILPPGWYPTSPMGRFPGLDGFGPWPERLWIPAVRVGDGEVVVFGRDRTDVTVRAAVEASSAVPGIFEPKEIDGEEYVDGGLASPTHADLAEEIDPDVVIVSSPMTRPSGRPMARLAKRRLDPERDLLVEQGIHTLVIEPVAEEVGIFKGFPRRNPGAAPDILKAAAAATRRALDAHPELLPVSS